jgi:diguanylate cyclase
MKVIKNFRPYIILLLISLTIVVFGIIFSVGSSRIIVDQPKSFNEGWNLVEGTQLTPLSSLPVQLDIDKNTEYTISKTLDDDFHQTQVVLIRTSLQNIIVKIDNQVFYEKNYQTDSQFPPYASMWHFITVPEHSDGTVIEITFFSPYQAMSGTVNEMYCGTHAALYGHLFETYGYRLAVGLFVLFVGILMMTLSLVIYRKYNQKYTYIGLFSILISLWMIAESRMIQWITGNEMIIGSLAYVMLPMFPIPILYYLKNFVINRFNKIYQILIFIFYAQSIFVVAMHALGLMDFFETVAITQIILLMGFTTVITTLLIEMFKFNNKNVLKVVQILGVMMVFALLEIINFFMNNFNITSTFTITGTGVVMLILLINYVHYLIVRLKISYEKEIYEKLAFHDWLTGGMNRLKFEQDFDRIFTEEDIKQKLRLIYFDFDDLKKVNDDFGHLEGDKAIKKGFQLISSIFGDKGECYRIGGDEFACLVTDMDHKAYQAKSRKLRDEVQAFSKELSYPFRISIGTASFHDTVDLSPKDLIKRADDDMYLDKCTFKDNCKRKFDQL